MPIQRLLKAISDGRAPSLINGPRSALGLILLALLVSACRPPSRPRLPELPFFPSAGESEEAARSLRIFLPEEGEVTEALRRQVSAWAAAVELRVELSTAAEYARQLRIRLSEKEPPDLFVVSGFLFPDLAADGFLAAPEEGILDPEGYPPLLAQAFMQPSQGEFPVRYCLPREVRTLALVYDREGLAAAGQAPPTDWNALRTVAEAQTDLDINRFGFIESPDLSRWLPFLYGAGGTIVDESGSMAFQSPAAAAALDWYIQIFRDNFAGHPGESNSEWAGEVLAKGKGAMTIEGNWIAPYFAAEFPAFRYAVAPLPQGPAQLNDSVAFSSCYAVSSRSELKKDAFALAAFLSSPQVTRALPNDGGWMPAQTALREEWRKDFPYLDAFAQAVPTARPWQLQPGFEPILVNFNRGMFRLFAAEIERADLLAELQQVGEEILSSVGRQ